MLELNVLRFHFSMRPSVTFLIWAMYSDTGHIYFILSLAFGLCVELLFILFMCVGVYDCYGCVSTFIHLLSRL